MFAKSVDITGGAEGEDDRQMKMRNEGGRHTGGRFKLEIIMLTIILLLTGCGKGMQNAGADSAREAAEQVMESLKVLDLETFNDLTDNYVRTYHNWLGMPTQREYRVFNELLQPGIKSWKRYSNSYELSEKILENLSWEITDVRESDGKAEIDMVITNLDMGNAEGYYEIYILENMLLAKGTGITQLMRDMSDLLEDNGGLYSAMELMEDKERSMISVTVSAYQAGGSWKLHVSDEFINAFMGNINTDEYAEDIERKIRELETACEKKADEWADDFADDVEGFVEALFP